GIDAGMGSGLGRKARFAKPGPDSMKRGAVRPDGTGAALGPDLGREARFAKPGPDSMKRGAVRADGVDAPFVSPRTVFSVSPCLRASVVNLACWRTVSDRRRRCQATDFAAQATMPCNVRRVLGGVAP